MKSIVKNAIILGLITSITIIVERILFVAYPTYLIEKGFSATEIGATFSFASLLLIFGRTYIGKISDIIGRKGIMSLGLLISSFTTFLYTLANNILHFILLKGFKEVSDTLVSSVDLAIKADVFPKRVRARIIAKLESLVPLSRAIATVLGFTIFTWLSIKYSFYFSFLILFLAFLIFQLFFKEKKKKVKSEFKITLNPFKYSKSFNALVFMGFIQSLTYGAAYFPAFFILAENYLNIKPSTLYILLLVGYIISTIIIYNSGKIIDRIGRKRVSLIGMFLIGLFTIFYSLVENMFQFLLVMIAISVSYYFWRVGYKTALMDETSEEKRGEQIGFYQTMLGIGDSIGPLIGGFLIDNVSIKFVFIISGLLGISTVPLLRVFAFK